MGPLDVELPSCASHVRHSAANYQRSISPLLVTKRPSWSDSSSTKQAMYTGHVRSLSSKSTGHVNHLTSSDSGNVCLANSSDDSSERGSEEQLASDEVLVHTSPVFSAQRKRSCCHAPAGIAQPGGIQSLPVQEETHPPATNTKQAAPEQSHHRSRKAKSWKRCHRRSSSSESSSSSSGTSSSSSSESSDSNTRRIKWKSKRHK